MTSSQNDFRHNFSFKFLKIVCNLTLLFLTFGKKDIIFKRRQSKNKLKFQTSALTFNTIPVGTILLFLILGQSATYCWFTFIDIVLVLSVH